MAGEMNEMAQTAIGRAIIAGDCKQFSRCIAAGEDIHFTDRKGNTFLHFIATMYRPYIFHRLIATDINVNAQNKDGNTALHVTALQEECCHVADLMASGIDPFIKNKNKKRADEIATKSLYWRNIYDRYAPGLRQAISDHDLERVRYLLNCWCSVEAVIYGKDMRQHAAALTYHDIVAIIDEWRFSVMAAHSVLECNIDKLNYALSRNECDPNFLQRVSGAHAHHMLQHAIKQNNRHLVSILVDAGADVNTSVKIDEYLTGPLFFSTLQSSKNFDRRITGTVLAAHPDINAKEEKGRSAICYALDRTEGETTLYVVERMLELGADIALRDDTGCTARDIAMFHRRHDVRDAIDKNLINAIKASDIPKIRQLAMDGYTDIFIEYKYRDTFIYASGNETEEMTQFLLTLEKYWIDAEQLHKLCEQGRLQEVQTLLESHADREMMLKYKDKFFRWRGVARWPVNHIGRTSPLLSTYRTSTTPSQGLAQSLAQSVETTLKGALFKTTLRNGVEGGRTPLMKAVVHNNHELAGWFISQCPDCIHQQDNMNRSALQYIVKSGQRDSEYYQQALNSTGDNTKEEDIESMLNSTDLRTSREQCIWLEKEKKAVYGLDHERVCIEQYERLLRIIRSNTLTIEDFNTVLKELKCPVAQLPKLFKRDKYDLVPRYRDLVLAAMDHGKDEIVKKLVHLDADCNIIEKYRNKDTGECRLENAMTRAQHIGRDDLAEFIRHKLQRRGEYHSHK